MKKRLAPNGGYEVGGRYISGYWQREFTVLALHNANEWNWAVTVRWADGHVTTHSTPFGLDRRDKRLA